MVDQEQYNDGLDRARDLSSADNSMPQEAESHYRGPDALGQAGLRGTFLGYAGWKIGNWLGNIGSKPMNLDTYRTFKARNLGGLLGFVGAITGVYGGLKDVRFYDKQVDDLQDIVQKQNTKIGDLQTELKEQIKARNGNGAPKLAGYDPSWEREEKPKQDEERAVKEEPDAEKAEGKETPETTVAADEAAHEKPTEKTREIA